MSDNIFGFVTRRDPARNVVFTNEETGIDRRAVAGAIEITSITESEVKGRIDAKFDGENFVNGNFIVARCK